MLPPASRLPPPRSRSNQLFQYSGSSADASNGFRTTASSATISDGNHAGSSGDDSGGDSGSTENSPKGKGKGKSKGKEKASVAAVAASATGPAAAAAGTAGSSPQDGDEDEGECEAEAPIGHAMLKSRLVSVSLRGLVQVDDKAVAVRILYVFVVSPREVACSPPASSAEINFHSWRLCPCHLHLGLSVVERCLFFFTFSICLCLCLCLFLCL